MTASPRALALADDLGLRVGEMFEVLRNPGRKAKAAALGMDGELLADLAQKLSLVSRRLRSGAWTLESDQRSEAQPTPHRPTRRRKAMTASSKQSTDPDVAATELAALQLRATGDGVRTIRGATYADPDLRRRREEFEEEREQQRQAIERQAREEDARQAREQRLLAGFQTPREEAAGERLSLIQAIAKGSFEPPPALANRPWTREADGLVEKARTAAREAVRLALQPDFDAALAERTAARQEREQVVAELRRDERGLLSRLLGR